MSNSSKPDDDESRHPAPNTIDQRSQQIDPARHHTADPNDRTTDNTKQPGGGRAKDQSANK